MLQFIWIISAFLAAVALAIMLVLVALRVVHDRRAVRHAAQRQRLQAALIRFTADEDEEALSAVVRETRPSVTVDIGFEFLDLLRGSDRSAIERVFEDAGLAEYVRRMIARGNDAERLHAVEILIAFPGDETIRSLQKAVRNSSREVRIAAAISLARLDRLPSLATTLDRIGPRGQRSRRLVELFRQLAQDRAEELKGYATDPAGMPFLRAAAVDALSQSGDYQLIPFFDEAANDPSSEVKAAAIRALGRCAHPASAQQLLAALDSSDWEVRLEAAEAIGRIGLDDAAMPLARLLDDDEWTVRYAAARTLKGLGAAGAAQLHHLSTRGSKRGQRTAALVIAEGHHS